jgi:O-antigen ligase
MSTRAVPLGFQGGGELSPWWAAVAGGAVVFGAAATVALGPVALTIPLGIAVAILLVRSPPLLLVAYGYVGVFKEGALLKNLPFDATVALALLLAAVCLWRLVEGRARPVPPAYLGLLLLIGVMLALSLSWTPMPDYGGDKVLKFFTLTPLAALAPFFIIEDRRDLRTLLWATVGLAVLAAVLSLVEPGSAETGRLEFGGNENTIFTSRLLCAGALVLLVAPALGVPPRLRLVAPLLGVGLVLVALGVGSRGPIVALALSLACVAAASVVKSPRQLVSVLAIVAAGIALFPLIQLPETSRQRLEQTVNNPVQTLEEDGRSRLYNKAIELTAENPVRGFGAGGFFLYSYVLMNQEEKYPHNMFLELSAEVGLLPPILLGLAVLWVLFTLGRRAWTSDSDRDRRLTFVLGGLFLINLFAVQFSGDINDNRVFWAMFGIAWLVARYGIPERDRGPWLALDSSPGSGDR